MHSIHNLAAAGTTEDSFHFLWDGLIFQGLKFALQGIPYSYNRNTNKLTETGANRPDLSIIISDYCVFRGEEKAPLSLGIPGTELVKKLIWTYGRLPYVLGYYATGFKIKLCAIYQDEDGSVKKTDISETFDLTHLICRYQMVTAMFNLAPILVNLAKLCPSAGAYPDLVCERPTKTISLKGSMVYKAYKTNAIFNRVKAIYRY